MNAPRLLILSTHAFVGWGLCFATIGIGMATTSQQNALIIHAIGAPIYFTLLSLNYHRRFNYTAPFTTAVFFTGFVIFVDFFVVALLIMRSLEMFGSLLGTWTPFALIFVSTLTAGLYTARRSHAAALAH